MKGSVFACKLRGKRVIDTGGGNLGVVDDLRAEDTGGFVTALVLKPELAFSELGKKRVCSAIPFDAVKAVKAVIVVDRAKLTIVGDFSAASKEEKRGELGITKAKQEPSKVKRVKGRSAMREQGSEAGDDRTRRRVSKGKEQPAAVEESSELGESMVLRTAPANDWAQRRLLRCMQPPAFDHPAFRHPASEMRHVISEPQEPPKGEHQ